MNIFKIISRLLAVIVAGIEVIAVYLRDDAFSTESIPYIPAAVTGPLIIAGPLILIWFSDSLAEREEERGSWCPSPLIQFAGWIFFLLLGLLLYKY